VEAIRELMGAESLGYLSLQGLRRGAAALKHGTCDGCFSDEYPVAITNDGPAPQLSLFRSVGQEDE
jgi:amidophosphoribosyltransferase